MLEELPKLVIKLLHCSLFSVATCWLRRSWSTRQVSTTSFAELIGSLAKHEFNAKAVSFNGNVLGFVDPHTEKNPFAKQDDA